METHGSHWTVLGVDTVFMSNQFFLDDVLLCYEKEADKVDLSEHGVGHCLGIVGLLYNEELYVLDTEGVLGGVGTALVVFTWTEE